MKIRTGFVSNSSSSSFCVVGTDNKQEINKILKYIGIKLEDGQIPWEDKYPNGFEDGDFGQFTYDDLIIVGQTPYIIGLSAEEILENTTLKETRKNIIKTLNSKYGTKLEERDIQFHYGESSNES